MEERTREVIEADYARLCAKAGHLQYQMAAFSKELETINTRLKELNQEAAALTKKE